MHADGTPASWDDLPRELRDMVYPHLWEGTAPVRPATGYSRRDAFEVHYGHFEQYEGRMSGLPRWLLTSKQILREGLEQFNKHATWVCHADMCDRVGDQYSSLIGPSVATNLVLLITLDCRDVLTNFDPTARKLKQPYQLLASLVPKLCREMRFLTLDVSLDDKPTIGFLKNPPWHIDLSLFDRLDLQLDSITLHVSATGSVSPKHFLSRLLYAHAAELNRVGQKLVGPDGTVKRRRSTGIRNEKWWKFRFEFTVEYSRMCITAEMEQEGWKDKGRMKAKVPPSIA